MDRKRGDVAIGSPKAQITIFMILGLVILFVFLFLIQLSIRLNQDKLELSKENVVAQAFKKEGLRLYVDDCLQDELEQGLLLLGRQGRLWADQPGGRLNFEPGKTGIIYAPGEELGEFDSSRVAYGLTRKTYLERENAYPCIEEANAPAFCQYRFPNTSLGFGSLELLPSTLKGDLQRFMANRTVWCVQQFLLNNVSRQVVLESKPAEVSVDVFDDGISVKSEYPLRFKVGQNEFFHLSTFDFFYSSQFGKFLNDIITFPLQQDQHYLDFDYSPESLNEPFFTFSSEVNLGRTCVPQDNIFVCPRSLRPGTMGSLAVEVTAAAAEHGDDVFTFKPALYKIVNSPAQFMFRVARQNRPPALSYINRSQCPAGDYDYLVIKGHETLGGINLSTFALDPDEDGLFYKVEDLDGTGGAQDENNFSLDEIEVLGLSASRYNLIVNITDESGLSDWQKVRLLVDRPMQPTISLRSPYDDPQASYDLGENYYRLSKEDPVYLTFSVPEASKDYVSSGEEVVFNYFDGVETKNIQLNYEEGRPEGGVCYSLPISQSQIIQPERQAAPCDTLAGYTEQDVVRGFPEEFHFFRQTTANGKLKLGYSVNYCGAAPLMGSAELNVMVKDCVPHKNPAHPFPYPYHKYTFGTKEENGQKVTDLQNFVGDQDINPFETTHTCCDAQWNIRENGDPVPCFVNPLPLCSGKIEGFPTEAKLLKQQKRLCDGKSGISCSGAVKYELWHKELRCGSNGITGCDGDIPPQCQGNLSFSLIKGKGWCYGKVGCERLCPAGPSGGLVYTGRGEPRPLSLEDSAKSIKEINMLAKNWFETNNNLDEFESSLDYKCGCGSTDDHKKCDADFDGSFNGECLGGTCD